MSDLVNLLLDPATAVAPRLLGSVLATVNDRGESVGLRLTEVEAYEGVGDPGSHAYRGLTDRTRPMFGAPPQVYVYLSYGIHSCLNIVCAPEGEGQGCLVRAGEILWGSHLMPTRRPKARTPRDWARGPGNVGSALQVSTADSGHFLKLSTFSTLSFISEDAAEQAFHPTDRLTLYLPENLDAQSTEEFPNSRVGTTHRIGVNGPGGDPKNFPWRFYLKDEPTVSRHPKA